jgi:DsbC/DsbD-like thiol-disulfide interchange protein
MGMKSGRLLAGCGVVVLLAIFTTAPAGAQVYEGKQIVKATLLADTAAVVPGKPLTVGLLLRMAAGWHTYWKFSGDAGLPTEIKWKLPPGWKIGEIEWPIPLKLKDPGDIVTYGYNDEVLLMQQITPPASVADTTVKLSAEASWLVCERICIPGSASLELELPRGSSAGVATAAKSISAAPANTGPVKLRTGTARLLRFRSVSDRPDSRIIPWSIFIRWRMRTRSSVIRA